MTDRTPDPSGSVDERLSRELGIDVTAVEAHARLRLDLLRMQRGEPGQLRYVLLNRRHHPNAAVVFASPDEARRARGSHTLIDSLCKVDCLDTSVPDPATLSDLASREVILP